MSGFDEQSYYERLKEVTSKADGNELQQAYARVQRERRRKKRMQYSFVTAALICITMLGLIRYSSTVANAIAQLPGMKPLVEMIALDKGFHDIVENEYYEEIGVSQAIDGMTLTITGVVADESGMVIYYKLKSPDDVSKIEFRPSIELLQNGKPIEAGVGWGFTAQEEGTYEFEEEINVIANDTKLDYSSPHFELQFTANWKDNVTFNIPFTLEKPIQPSKKIAVNEVLSVDGQKFTVKELNLSPLRTELVLSVDEANSMKVLSFNDIRLYDENGEEWGAIKNGIVGKGSIDEESFSLMLESNYFRTPKSLTLVFKNIEAIAKEDAFIEVDWETKKVLQQPSNIELAIELRDAYEIVYSPKQTNLSDYPAVFGEMVDAAGTVFTSYSMWSSDGEDGRTLGQFYEVQMELINPVRIAIERYEHYLSGSASVTIQVPQ